MKFILSIDPSDERYERLLDACELKTLKTEKYGMIPLPVFTCVVWSDFIWLMERLEEHTDSFVIFDDGLNPGHRNIEW